MTLETIAPIGHDCVAPLASRYEKHIGFSEAVIQVAMGGLLLGGRIAHRNEFPSELRERYEISKS